MGSFYLCVLVLKFQPQRSYYSSSQVQGTPQKTLPPDFSQIPRLHTDPSCWPTRRRGWCQWGRTHWQARKLDLWKDTGPYLRMYPVTLKHLVSYRTVKSPCYLQGSQTALFCGLEILVQTQSRWHRAPHSAFLKSRAVFSFNTFNVFLAPLLDFLMNGFDEPFSCIKYTWLSA